MGMFDNIMDSVVQFAKNHGLMQTDPNALPTQPIAPAPAQQSMVRKAPTTWAERRKALEEEVARNPEKYLPIYRMNHKSGGLETLPTFINKDIMGEYLKAYRESQKHGNNGYTPEDLMAILAQEARPDFGFNDFHYPHSSKEAKRIYDALTDAGFDHNKAGFAALLKEKELVAKRLGISKFRSWNGTGVNQYGQSGHEYANKVNQTKDLINHEKNKPVKDYFYKVLSPEKRAALESLDYNDPFGDSIA